MPAVDPNLARRIADCARAVTIAKSQMEAARNFDERLMLQKNLERAEAELNQVSMQVNRGLSRPEPRA